MLNAVLTIQSAAGARELPIADFYNKDGIAHMALEPGELVTHVTIPPCEDRSVFIKFTPRKGMDFSLGAVAARCSGSGEQAADVSSAQLAESPALPPPPARLRLPVPPSPYIIAPYGPS